MLTDQITTLLSPVLADFDLELEAVDVVPAGKRRVVRIVVDGDGPAGSGPLLDDIAEATQAISAALDNSDALGNAPYTLEVSSRGVSRPLVLPRHWRRNAGRLVAVRLTDSRQLTGRITSSSDDSVVLDVDGTPQTLALADVADARVQVELNRKAPAGEADGEED